MVLVLVWGMLSKSLSADNMELIRANKFCLGGRYECGGPADMESINSVMNFVIKLALIVLCTVVATMH